MDLSSFAPQCICEATEGYQWIEMQVGDSGADVYRLESRNQAGLYVKYGTGSTANDILSEMVRLTWLAPHLPVPQVLRSFCVGDEAWLITTSIPGHSAYDCLTANRRDRVEIVKDIAQFLRRFHSISIDECPFNSDHTVRMADARRRIESKQVDESDFDVKRQGWSTQKVWDEMQGLLPLPFDRVVTHGDFSLDNILLQDGWVTGCIDVGRVGVADPYQDLAILWNNLEEFGEDTQASLFDAYGIEAPDARKIQFHLCLDEFF
jgi:aminoglycoside 3'-phosphotransferase I